MTDPMDQPEDDGMELVVPFIVCTSQGGPYDDDAFVAGFQCGEIDRALMAAASVGATVVEFGSVRTALIKQLELIAMNRGFPVVEVATSEEWPEWSAVAFCVRANTGSEEAPT